MALIKAFTHKPGQPFSWRSEVECGYTVGDFAGKPVVHLETYGSGSREIPGKVSQSLEIDEQRARDLIAILRETFSTLR